MRVVSAFTHSLFFICMSSSTVALAADPAGDVNPEAVLKAVIVKDTVDAETATGPVRGYAAKRSATGTKTDTPLLETPQSISVVSAERMAAMDASTVREALSYTPGVGTTTWGSDSRYEWLQVRGFDAYSPGFYMDGLLLRNISTWGVWQTDNYGNERIEVLRGPSSALYGQGSPGGMINIISKRPTAEPIRELQFQLGQNQRRQLAGDFAGALDSEGIWTYRFTAMVRDAEVADMDGGLRDDRTYIAPALTWQPSADTSLTVLSHFQRTRTVPSYRGLPERGTLLPNPNGKIDDDIYPGESDFDHWDQDQWMIGYEFEHRFNDTWSVRQHTRYGRLDLEYDQVWGAPWLGFVEVNPAVPDDPANFRRMQRVVFGSDETAKTLSVDNQAVAELQMGDWHHAVLAGLDSERTTFDQVTYYGGSAGSIDLYDPVYGQADIVVPEPYVDGGTVLKQTGLYVQDQIKWGNHWAATLGGRWDRATLDVTNRAGGFSKNSKTDQKFSGRAGIVYLAPNGIAPYLSYSESFSPILGVNPATGAPFNPETGRQIELGTRWQPIGGKAIYSAAVFDLRRQNYVTTDTVTNTSRQTGEVTSQGLELEAIVEPMPQMNVTLAYTWQPKVEVSESSNGAEIGKQLQGVPKHQGSAWMDYRFALGFKIGLGVRYIGSTHGYLEGASREVPDYALLDALLGYEFGHWELALNARNLTDKTTLASNCNSGDCQYNGRRKLTASAIYRW